MIGNMTNGTDLRAGWSVAEHPVSDPTSVGLLRRYFFDVASSFHGRPASDAEVSEALADEPSDDLAAPTGVFLVARLDDAPSGCVGVRLGPPGLAELTRMFVVPEARGRGGGPTLLAAAEEWARRRDIHTIRLDTRLDLLSARRLYTAHGYREIPAYSRGPYAECWYAKEIA
jgi:GNAT superfamily N-acetyltransferase